MTTSSFSAKNKLGFVSLIALFSFLVFSVIEVKATEALVSRISHKISEKTLSAKEVLLLDVHVYYVVPADLMVNRLELEDTQQHMGCLKDASKDETGSENPKVSLKMSRKEFNEQKIRRLAAEAGKRIKLSGDCGSNRDEE